MLKMPQDLYYKFILQISSLPLRLLVRILKPTVLAKPWLDSRCGDASLRPWERPNAISLLWFKQSTRRDSPAWPTHAKRTSFSVLEGIPTYSIRSIRKCNPILRRSKKLSINQFTQLSKQPVSELFLALSTSFHFCCLVQNLAWSDCFPPCPHPSETAFHHFHEGLII